MEQVTLPLWVVGALLAVLGFLLTFILKGIFTQLKTVNGGIAETSAAVGKLVTWSEFHQREDDDRHLECKEERKAIREAIEHRQKA